MADSIQVFVRLRAASEEQSCFSHSQNSVQVDRSNFSFDRVFGADSSQEDIFKEVGSILVSRVLEGYNGTVMVYGQTGSGKTYTMQGVTQFSVMENQGLMQRSFRDIFERMPSKPNSTWFMTCSYYELYNEQLIDLLDHKKDKRLLIRQDCKRGVYVENLSEESIDSCQGLFECLDKGARNRHVGETLMNRQSSRSHSIFTINFSIKKQGINGTNSQLLTPKLHFVDLAGSERQKMTLALGDRLREASNINRSLTTLGMVIHALSSQKGHIPFRDSKLTSLLRDSLGGNSRTFLIATVSSALESLPQTLSTLSFAHRAKMVKLKAFVNEEAIGSRSIQAYKQQIRALKMELATLRAQVGRGLPNGNRQIEAFENIRGQMGALAEQMTKSMVTPTLQKILAAVQSQNRMSYTVGSLQSAPIASDFSVGSVFEGSAMQAEDNDGNATAELMGYLSSNFSLLSQINCKVSQQLRRTDRSRLAELHDEVANLESETPAKMNIQLYESSMQKAQSQMEGIRQQLTMVTEFTENMGEFGTQTHLTELESKRPELLQKISELQASLNEQSILYSELAQKLRLEKDLNLKHQQIEQSLETTIERLDNDLLEQKDKVEQFERSYERRIEEVQTHNEQLIQENQLLLTSIELQRQTHSELTEKEHQALKANAQLNDQVKELQIALSQSQMALQSSMLLKDLANEKNIRSSQELQCLQKHIIQLQREKEDIKQRAKEVQDQRNQSQQKLNAQIQVLVKSQAEVATLHARLQQVIRRSSQSQDKMISMQQRLAFAQRTGRLEDQNRTNKNESSQVEYLESRCTLMSLEYEKVLAKYRQLKENEQNLLKKVEEQQQIARGKQLLTSKSETETLKAMLSKLQAENKRLLGIIEISADQSEAKQQINEEQRVVEDIKTSKTFLGKCLSALKALGEETENLGIGNKPKNKEQALAKLQAQVSQRISELAVLVKKEQKVRAQNGFIIHENTYLRNKLKDLEAALPSKRVKMSPRKEQVDSI